MLLGRDEGEADEPSCYQLDVSRLSFPSKEGPIGVRAQLLVRAILVDLCQQIERDMGCSLRSQDRKTTTSQESEQPAHAPLEGASGMGLQETSEGLSARRHPRTPPSPREVCCSL